MAKELPYFKFEPSEWTHGNIQMCSNDAKASFIELCCLYWNRLGSCSVKLAIALSCNRNENVFNELINCNIIQLKGDYIVIKFLDVQLKEFNLIKKARAESGKKGGQKGGVRPIEERKKGNQIYIIECWNKEERFYKIGTTSNCISRRYSGKIQYEYKLVFQYFTEYFIDAEKSICEKLVDYEYKPKLNFAGQKECYKYSSFKQIETFFNDYFKFAQVSLKRTESIREDKIREDKNNLNIIPQNQKNDFKAEVDLSEIEVIDEECLVGDAHWGTKLKVVEEKEKSSEKKEKEFSNEVVDCYSECLGYFDPSLHPKKKDIYSWLDTIEKLNRLEHLQFSDIVLIVKKAREDEFWSKNFLSLTKLRRKDKDKIPYWRVFIEKFKNTSPNVKPQKMNAGEIIKAKYGL